MHQRGCAVLVDQELNSAVLVDLEWDSEVLE